jgi:methylated-DNA-protein-cysteine methyltransferase related protein
MPLSFFDRVYAVVRLIPPGRVAAYGQIAGLCEHPHAARTVGWALHGLPEDLADPENPEAVPWWRVIHVAGRISTTCLQHSSDLQRSLLEAEGVLFGSDGRTDWGRFRWDRWIPPDLTADGERGGFGPC